MASNSPLPRPGITPKPRITLNIPPPQHHSPYAPTPYLSTAHTNNTSGVPPQWPQYENPFIGNYSSKAGEFMFKQFEGFKDFTMASAKSGLNVGEKSAFYIYEKFSKWSRKWFTHIFLVLVMFLYSIGGAFLFSAIEGAAQTNENISERKEKYKLAAELQNLALADIERLRNITMWESEVVKALDTFSKALQNSAGKPEWNFKNSLFFCGTVYTTIGYGHITPVTLTGRAITIVYAIIGIPMFLILLADFGKLFTRIIKFVWAYVRRLYYTGSIRKVRKQAQVQGVLRGMNMAYEIATFRRPSMMVAKPEPTDIEHASTTPQSTSTHLAPPSSNETPTTPMPPEIDIDDEFNLPISLAFTILLAYIFFGAAVYKIWENWTFFDSCYFVFVSMSTIGFGDLVPQHPIFMMASIIYLVFGLALTSMCINVVQVKLSDSFRQASAKIGATIGLSLAEEEARNSQNASPIDAVSVHSSTDSPNLTKRNANDNDNENDHNNINSNTNNKNSSSNSKNNNNNDYDNAKRKNSTLNITDENRNRT